MDDNLDVSAISRERLVDRVVDDLVDQMVQALWTGGTNVHARPLAHGFETLQNLDVLSRVRRVCGHTCSLAAHTWTGGPPKPKATISCGEHAHGTTTSWGNGSKWHLRSPLAPSSGRYGRRDPFSTQYHVPSPAGPPP